MKPPRSDGRYRRTRLTMARVQTTKAASPYTIGGRKKQGKNAPRPITLPKTPWDDKKPD
jgi:hypothetical protein